MQKVKSTPAGFARIRSHRIETLDLEVIEYEHRGTGAKHFHLASDHEERVFMVALRTAPEDSTGVAHILEHTALVRQRPLPSAGSVFLNASSISEYFYECLYGQ